MHAHHVNTQRRWVTVCGRDSRLGGVHGCGRVADVLGALEHSEGQAGQEVPGGQQARGRTQLEARLLCEDEDRSRGQSS